MENIQELIQRLLQIQGGGGQRSPRVMAEGKRASDLNLTADQEKKLHAALISD